MPTPMEICLEDLDLAVEDERYIRCVALPGGEPGLALDREGAVRWMPDGPAAYGLWVSADDRLVILRGEEADPILVERGGRSQEAPIASPVLLLDGDLLRVNGRSLQVHIHGATEAIYEPERLSLSALARAARTTTAALALSLAVGAGVEASAQTNTAPGVAAATPIEVRTRPPAPPRPRRKVFCKITAQKVDKSGDVMVHADCPELLNIGAWGQMLDAKDKPIKNGSVTVKTVDQNKKIIATSQLKKPVKATKIKFMRH